MLEVHKIDHLLRRVGFVALPEERKRAYKTGFEGTVRRLFQASFDYQIKSAPPQVPVPAVIFPITLLTFGRGITWWLKTMAESSSPLNERLTMFWHRHFATSGQKVFKPGWMFEQNQTFRRLGTGAFADLLKAMVADRALLRWLDADSNKTEQANENFARELLELFTLGPGNYSEEDVRQLAKISQVSHRQTAGLPVRVLGNKGQLTLQEMAEYLAVHPQTARRLVAQLWEDFAAAPLPEVLARKLESHWRRSRGNTSLVLREMFLSPAFYKKPKQRVTSPVEYWVACARILQWKDFRLQDASFLEQAGEQLFFPPSVKGWELGMALIHPAALQTRFEIASHLVQMLPDDHFALRGLAQSADPKRYLHYLSGGQIASSTLPPNLSTFSPREALVLGLASPDLWIN